jgi:hypothetical protein
MPKVTYPRSPARRLMNSPALVPFAFLFPTLGRGHRFRLAACLGHRRHYDALTRITNARIVLERSPSTRPSGESTWGRAPKDFNGRWIELSSRAALIILLANKADGSRCQAF